MSKYFTEKQIKKIKNNWHFVQEAEDRYYEAMAEIEATLQDQLELDIEIFSVDGEIVGVGTYDRKYEMLHIPDMKYFDKI